MRRLVQSWVHAEREQHGNSVGGAIKRLNEHLGMRVTYSRAAEWRRGTYVPSQLVLTYVLYRVLPWALKQAGISVTKDQRRALESLLWTPVEKDGKAGVELL